jgi:hypothetical protein
MAGVVLEEIIQEWQEHPKIWIGETWRVVRMKSRYSLPSYEMQSLDFWVSAFAPQILSVF